MQVAVGRREELIVHGGDYPTVDGTCVRDYIHVVDLARGHVAAVKNLRPGHEPLNLGTGVGSSVLEVLSAAERATGNPIAHRVGPRRPGDATMVYADPARAKDRLGWVASRTLEEMCADHWRWQRSNPDGYGPEL
jgi:UDP-glucose 4-epimerase